MNEKRRSGPRRADRFAERAAPVEEVEGQLEGRNAVAEALKSGRTIDKLFIAEGDTDQSLRRLAAQAREAGAVVVAENHNRNGGLYDAVNQVLAERCPVPACCVAVEDEFGEVGKLAYLAERFGLKAENIADAVRRVLKRK